MCKNECFVCGILWSNELKVASYCQVRNIPTVNKPQDSRSSGKGHETYEQFVLMIQYCKYMQCVVAVVKKEVTSFVTSRTRSNCTVMKLVTSFSTCIAAHAQSGDRPARGPPL